MGMVQLLTRSLPKAEAGLSRRKDVKVPSLRMAYPAGVTAVVALMAFTRVDRHTMQQASHPWMLPRQLDSQQQPCRLQTALFCRCAACV